MLASLSHSLAGGTVIQLGACDDKYTAADTAKLSTTAYTGAATYAFIESIERYGTHQTYATLLANMTKTLRGLGKASIKPQSAGGAMASGALPLVGAIALGPLGLLAGAALSTGMGECRSKPSRRCGWLLCALTEQSWLADAVHGGAHVVSMVCLSCTS